MSGQIVRIIDEPGSYKLVVPFVKEGELSEVLILIVGHKKGEYDFEILVDHRAGRTSGNVLIKGLADKGSVLNIGGTIKIAKDCPLVNDFLEMRVLLLDGESWSRVEPRLEIESSDVKASHAAAVSRISDEELFYLNTRGIGADDAKAMLVEGFLKEVVQKVEDEKMKEEINKKLVMYGYSKN